MFDKSISGDLLFEMLSLFIGVEKIAYRQLRFLRILFVLAVEGSSAARGGCFGNWR